MRNSICIAVLVGTLAVLVTGPAGAQSGFLGYDYIDGWIGITRPAKPATEDIRAAGLDVDVEAGTDFALGAAFGNRLTSALKLETEVAYVKVRYGIKNLNGESVDVTGEGTNVSLGLMYEFGEPNARVRPEVGLAPGWFFGGDVCAEFAGDSLCTDGNFDDWSVQVIAGGSIAVSESGAIVLRYRMVHVGGLDREDRIHLFTLGYRHHFGTMGKSSQGMTRPTGAETITGTSSSTGITGTGIQILVGKSTTLPQRRWAVRTPPGTSSPCTGGSMLVLGAGCSSTVGGSTDTMRESMDSGSPSRRTGDT